MATSGGPKIEREGLVFGFDTGYGIADTSTATRFYKGEPLSNEREVFHNQSSLPTDYVWTYEYDHTIVDAPIKGHPLSGYKWIKSTRDTTGSSRVLFLNNSFTAGRTYTFSCYAYSTDTRLTTLDILSHNSGYSVTQNATGYRTADLGKVKRIHGTWTQQVNGSSIFGMQTNNAALGTTLYLTGLQVEENAHYTPLSPTDRSSTQSLIDFVKTTDIDVSNISFDSSGLPTFDGTDDIISTSISNLPTGASPRTILAWVKITGTASSYYGILGYGTAALARTFDIGFRESDDKIFLDIYGSGGITSTNTITRNEWFQVTGLYTGTELQLYINGELENSNTYTINTGATTLKIGKEIWTTPEYLEGSVGSVRVYDRALTAEEIKENFNAYRKRFDI